MLQKSMKFIYIFLFIIYFLCFEGHTTSFYVSPTGNDANPGSLALPWRTIQNAANKAQAGDVVTVNAGTYTEMVIFKNSGSENNYISFVAMPGVVVRDPCPQRGTCGVWLFGGILEIEKKSYIRIKGFRLENSYFFGIAVKTCSNIILENNYTYNTGGSGLYASSSTNIIIDNNIVQKACWHTTALNTGSQECITVSDVQNFEIKNNEIFESGTTYELSTGGEGIDAKGSSTNGLIHHNKVHDLVRMGIYLDAWASLNENHLVYSNVVYNCREGILLNSENGGTLQNVKVFNNIIYNNEQSGIALEDYGQGESFPRKNISIVNNTIYNNGNVLYSGGITVRSLNISDIVIRNNICSKNKYWQIRVDHPSKVTVTNNLIDQFVGDAKEVRGSEPVQLDPQFVDVATGNFKIQSNSPAIKRGTITDAPLTDFADALRNATAGVDIGAYEYSGITGLAYENDIMKIVVSPNPTSDLLSIHIENSSPGEITKVVVTDMVSRVMSTSEHSNQNTIYLRLQDYDAGMYFIHVTQKNKMALHKVFLDK